MKKTGIYKITSPSGKNYIGQSIDIDRRKKQYQKITKKQTLLYNSIKKYGLDSHEFFILETINGEELSNDELIKWLDAKEIFYSLKFNSMFPNGLNLRIGRGGGRCSEEAKRKNRESHAGKKRLPFSEEWRYKLGSAQRGVPRSEETKEKIRKSNSGKNCYLFGKHHTEEFKQKVSAKLRGENNPMFGKTHTEEVKQKLRKPCAETTKKKISEAKRKRDIENPNRMAGKNNPMFGKSWSDEQRKKVMDYWERRRSA